MRACGWLKMKQVYFHMKILLFAKKIKFITTRFERIPCQIGISTHIMSIKLTHGRGHTSTAQRYSLNSFYGAGSFDGCPLCVHL